jgi:AcrR family transcriptional regulator
MATPPKNKDRRAERTRQLLRQAFLEVVREKGLTKASVQDIVDRANVSRGTFYAHYADKYALIDIIIREAFLRIIGKLPLSDGWNRKTLHLLIQAVLEYFKTVSQHHRSRDIGPVIDKAIHDELNTLILKWLKDRKPSDMRSQISTEAMAQIISWAIFGAALHWCRESDALSSVQMAHEIVSMLMDGTSSLLPEALPD